MIIISGAIGAGKSELSKLIANKLNSKAFLEEVKDNPILPLYYKDMPRYTFLLQIYFLNYRFNLTKQAIKNKYNVLDRSILEDALFFHLNAKNNVIKKEEMMVYDQVLATFLKELNKNDDRKNDLLIYIDMNLDTMLKHIKLRNRPYEQIENNPDLINYYADLLIEYKKFYKNYNTSYKLKIDADKYDFIANLSDQKFVLNLIEEAINLNKL